MGQQGVAAQVGVGPWLALFLNGDWRLLLVSPRDGNWGHPSPSRSCPVSQSTRPGVARMGGLGPLSRPGSSHLTLPPLLTACQLSKRLSLGPILYTPYFTGLHVSPNPAIIIRDTQRSTPHPGSPS